jgi:hypothetical protein
MSFEDVIEASLSVAPGPRATAKDPRFAQPLSGLWYEGEMTTPASRRDGHEAIAGSSLNPVAPQQREIPATGPVVWVVRVAAGVVARMVLITALAFVVNALAYPLLGAGSLNRCFASGGYDCIVAVVLAVMLLVAMPALYAAVVARSAALRALAKLVVDPAFDSSGWILRPIARTLAARLTRLRRSRLAARVDLSLDDYPFFVRNGLRLALFATGLGRFSRSAAYVRAADASDPVAEMTRLLQRDLASVADRRSVLPWWVPGANAILVAAAWAAIAWLVPR